jgi:HAD superfamily hydrolase (TIGR01509 family)
MVKLIIFDLDGVLVSTKELHFEALNTALARVGNQYVITLDEHLSLYDGLTTRQKLGLLTEKKGLPTDEHTRVWVMKQVITSELLHQQMKRDEKLCNLLFSLKNHGFKLALATNSIRETTMIVLSKLGITDFFDFVYTNEDVTSPKPHPEIYLRAMIAAKASPKETVILEDSIHGIQGAMSSGGNIMSVRNLSDVTYNNILNSINNVNLNSKPSPILKDKMNILIPMAGLGSRFEKAGYTFPKPLIDVNGEPMIKKVVDSLQTNGKYIYVVNTQHYEKYNLKHFLNLITPNCRIVQVDKLTEGAACTTLLAKEFINNDEELLIANSDQYIDWKPNEFYYLMANGNVDAGILTFEATHPKWSYVKVDDSGFVTEVAEKKPISNIATVGIYYWKQGRDYVKYAEQMISKNIRVNNEFYVCPIFNEAIQDKKRIKVFPVESMWGVGTPEDLEHFLSNYGK